MIQVNERSETVLYRNVTRPAHHIGAAEIGVQMSRSMLPFCGNSPHSDGSVHLDPASTINVEPLRDSDSVLPDSDWVNKSGVALRWVASCKSPEEVRVERRLKRKRLALYD